MYYQAKDTCTFLTKDQHIRLTAILFFAVYTSCRPAKLVNRSKGRARQQAEQDDLDDLDLKNPNCKGQDLKQGKDPDYDKPDP